MPREKRFDIDSHIGSRLRLRRLMLGMSQEVLGEKLSLTFQQVQKYEKGTNRVSASRLYELSLLLDVPVQYFFEGLDGMGSEETEGVGEIDSDNVTTIGAGVPTGSYLNFVSSSEGFKLNRAFLKIQDSRVRNSIIDLAETILDSQKK